MSNEAKIEQEITAKGLNAPRLNPQHITETIIGEQYHVFEGTTLTVCVLTLKNGFTVTGESAAASLENFDQEIARKIAKDNAREKIWQLEGYLLKQKLFEQSSDYIDRMKVELDDVTYKVDNLTRFTESEEFESLPKRKQKLLERQFVSIANYRSTLKERLNLETGE